MKSKRKKGNSRRLRPHKYNVELLSAYKIYTIGEYIPALILPLSEILLEIEINLVYDVATIKP